MMPSGGTRPINEKDWEHVRNTFEHALKHGLHYEWLRWYSGGIYYDRLSPAEAADRAAIEWDF